MLKVRRLSHHFGRYWALQNISFSIEKGEFVLLTGPSGAGKTTLLQILHGSLELQMGEVNIAGINMSRLRPRHLPGLRRQVSVVFQDFKILPQKTVQENIALPLEIKRMKRVQIKRRVAAVIRGLGLENKEKLLCQHLSGGEQQRVAIARSIVVNPAMFLADEPTGNLDEDLSKRLLEIFKKFNQHGTTILLATHNKSFLDFIPKARVLRLEQGKLKTAPNNSN